MKFKDFKSFIQFAPKDSYQVVVYQDMDDFIVRVHRQGMSDFTLRDSRSNSVRLFKSLDTVSRVLDEAGVTEWNYLAEHGDQHRKQNMAGL